MEALIADILLDYPKYILYTLISLYFINQIS